jgi:hypothetical protein
VNKKMKNILFTIFISAVISGCGEKINKTFSSKESFDECYSRTYKEKSDESAKELLKEGSYKLKDEIPEQELVPQGLRTLIEEDCKASSKK